MPAAPKPGTAGTPAIRSGLLRRPIPADRVADGPLDADVWLLPWTATLFIVAPIAGKQIARLGERALAAAGPPSKRSGWRASR